MTITFWIKLLALTIYEATAIQRCRSQFKPFKLLCRLYGLRSHLQSRFTIEHIDKRMSSEWIRIAKWKCHLVSCLSKPILMKSTPSKIVCGFSWYYHTTQRVLTICALSVRAHVFTCQRNGQTVRMSTPCPLSNVKISNFNNSQWPFWFIFGFQIHHFLHTRRILHNCPWSGFLCCYYMMSVSLGTCSIRRMEKLCVVWKVQFSTDGMIEVCNLQCLCI